MGLGETLDLTAHVLRFRGGAALGGPLYELADELHPIGEPVTGVSGVP